MIKVKSLDVFIMKRLVLTYTGAGIKMKTSE